jgi:hypothetical protein
MTTLQQRHGGWRRGGNKRLVTYLSTECYRDLLPSSGPLLLSRHLILNPKLRHGAGVVHGRDVGMGDSSELDELRLHVVLVTKADQGALVAHLVTVVGGAEHRDALAIVLHDVAFILHLVGPHHQLQVIGAQEVLCDVRAERKPNTSL